ncbi:MAG: 2-hydroxyacid dehydrogenase, partial [Geminicoccaceae bacterium]
PVVTELERRFNCHHIYQADAPLALLEEIGKRIRGAASHGMAGLSAEQIERMPNLEICVINGVGLETTDQALCRERNITVAPTPVLHEDVADIAIARALAAWRRSVDADRFVRAGRWRKGRYPLARKLTGMKSGLLGLGRIGVEVANRLQAFKCDLGYVDPIDREIAYRRYADAVEMAEDCDILFMCAAGAAKGKAPPIVTREILEALGPRGVFVNVARGWLVDEPAMIELLAAGKLGAAGLDVFEDEPQVPEPLLALENVVLTPHIASNTEETMGAMGELLIANLVSWFEGKGALSPVP